MGDCQYCIHDHAEAEGYPGGCPFFGSAKAWDPGRPRPPSAAQQHAWTIRALELRHAVENHERRQEAERRELESTRARAVMREYVEQQRQAQFDASRRALEPLRAEYHTWREAQELARGLVGNQAIRARERNRG
jgi:hypothetical protein